MPYVIICKDKPGALEIRLANRDKHLAYAGADPRLMFGGPFLEDGKMVGSMIGLNVATQDEAKAWAAEDPYAKAGLFETVEIREWKKVLG